MAFNPGYIRIVHRRGAKDAKFSIYNIRIFLRTLRTLRLFGELIFCDCWPEGVTSHATHVGVLLAIIL